MNAAQLPRTVVLGPHRWRLLVDDAGLLENAGECHGVTVARRHVIAVDGTLTGSSLAEVVLHELLHACLAGASIDHDDEERMVQAAAPQLLELLRRNRRLARLLIDG